MINKTITITIEKEIFKEFKKLLLYNNKKIGDVVSNLISATTLNDQLQNIFIKGVDNDDSYKE